MGAKGSWLIIVGTVALGFLIAIAFDRTRAPRPAAEAMQPGNPRPGADTAPPAAVEGATPQRTDQDRADEAVDDLLAQRREDMADAIYRVSGTRIVQTLIESGLAQSDSEEIARRYAADVAQCAMDSLVTEAESQSIAVDGLLSQMAAVVRDGGNPLSVVDRSRLEATAFACEADAMQRAGIANEAGAQISEEEIERLRECVESFRFSDISNQDIILETCTSEVFGEDR